MPQYAVMDDAANTIGTVTEENPDDALERAAREIGKPLTFDGDGPAPYVLLPLDQLSNLEGDPTWVDPERPVYVVSWKTGSDRIVLARTAGTDGERAAQQFALRAKQLRFIRPATASMAGSVVPLR